MIVSAEPLRDEIAEIRKKGYALDDQEKELGIRCIAAPVLNHRGEIEAAISISGALQRITTQRLPKLAHMVKVSALQVSQELGYEGG